MSILLWIALILVCALNAYTMQFTKASLSMGRALGNTDSKTGVQDAITPPWLTIVAIFGYLAGAIVLVAIGLQHGWLAAVAAIAISILLTGCLAGVLRSTAEAHFHKMMVASMMSRYANFIRDHDIVRAAAMKELLTRAGFDPDLMT